MSVDHDHGLGSEDPDFEGNPRIHPEYQGDPEESLPASELTKEQFLGAIESGVVERQALPYWYQYNGLMYGVARYPAPDSEEEDAIAGLQILHPEEEGLNRTVMYTIRQMGDGLGLEKSDISTAEDDASTAVISTPDLLPEQLDEDEDHRIHVALEEERRLGLREVSEAEAKRVIDEVRLAMTEGIEGWPKVEGPDDQGGVMA